MNNAITMNVNLKFEEKLKGKIEFLTDSKRDLHVISREEVKFISNQHPSCPNYKLEFVPFIENISFSINRDSTMNENPKGNYMTLLVDVKQV